MKRNCFWAATIDSLNDPNESLINDQSESFIQLFTTLFGAKRQNAVDVQDAWNNMIHRSKRCGVYSLSQDYDDELLWSHYANSHRGFCIEYDFELLSRSCGMNAFSFPVEYNLKPPIPLPFEGDQGDMLIRKLLGHKSEKWGHEREIRIITDLFGEQPYDHNALKAIYFGLRCSEYTQYKTMREFAGRGIKYFKMSSIKNSYKLKRIELKDEYSGRKTYLTQIISNENSNVIHFEIESNEFDQPNKKGMAAIILEQECSQDDILEIGKLIELELYSNAKLIFLFFHLKSNRKNIPWATCHKFANEPKFIVDMNDF